MKKSHIIFFILILLGAFGTSGYSIVCMENQEQTAIKKEKAQERKQSGTPSQDETSLAVSSLKELHPFLLEKAEANEFSGAVMIAKDGKPLFRNAYGLASKRFDVPNKVDTKFNLGSINKLFTSVAILQLAEKGMLTLDDPVGKFLDIFPEEIGQKVTIRHLLDMSSGWGDYWDHETFNAKQTKLRKVSEYMDFIKDMPLDFEPGSDMQHSNTGFEVAGAVIEKLSGMDYYDYVRKHIYEPLGMDNSDSFNRDGPVKNLAMGYTNFTPKGPVGKGYEWSNAYLLSPRGTPAGGGYSTVDDMLKIDQALRKSTILKKDFTHVIWNGFRGNPGDPINPMVLERMWVSAGGAPGISAIWGISLKDGVSFIILSNYDFPVAMDIFRSIREIDLERK